MMKIAIFASGNGSNFSAIEKALRKGSLRVKLSLLVCDNPEAFVIRRAVKAKVKVLLVRREDFARRDDFERAIIQRLRSEKIELIVLAGFMRILSADFVRRYRNRILNIHPAMLPAFKGARAIKDAFLYGAKFTGVSVHFVDRQADHGALILQEPVKIEEGDTLSSLEKKIHRLEHKLYPEAIRLFCAGRLKVRGRKVFISTR